MSDDPSEVRLGNQRAGNFLSTARRTALLFSQEILRTLLGHEPSNSPRAKNLVCESELFVSARDPSLLFGKKQRFRVSLSFATTMTAAEIPLFDGSILPHKAECGDGERERERQMCEKCLGPSVRPSVRPSGRNPLRLYSVK